MPNWNLLRALSAFLISIVQNADVSKMSVRNITIVFSPTLNIPGPVFSAFLTDYDAIFGQEPTSPSPIQVTPASPELSADDIRSPRRQLFSEIPTPSYTQSTFASNGLGLTYDDVLHNTHHDHVLGTGFTPLQPSYENPQPASLARKPSVTMPGPEYGAFQRTLGSNLTAQQRDTKARRRESSMLLMGNNGLQVANRKSSMPVLNGGSCKLATVV
jgi:RalA-binding protein 1